MVCLHNQIPHHKRKPMPFLVEAHEARLRRGLFELQVRPLCNTAIEGSEFVCRIVCVPPQWPTLPGAIEVVSTVCRSKSSCFDYDFDDGST